MAKRISKERIALTANGQVAALSNGVYAPPTDTIACQALVSFECTTAAARVVLAGSPTASIGHIMSDKTELFLESIMEIEGFRVIQVGAGTVTLQVTYWFEI